MLSDEYFYHYNLFGIKTSRIEELYSRLYKEWCEWTKRMILLVQDTNVRTRILGTL